MQRSTLPTIAVRDGRAPIDTTNPHALGYAVASIRGSRARYARQDRETAARLREVVRDADSRATRRNLGRSVGCRWGDLSTAAIDGPSSRRVFGPEQARWDRVGLAVDADHRARLFDRACQRLSVRRLGMRYADGADPSAALAISTAAVDADRAHVAQAAAFVTLAASVPTSLRVAVAS